MDNLCVFLACKVLSFLVVKCSWDGAKRKWRRISNRKIQSRYKKYFWSGHVFEEQGLAVKIAYSHPTLTFKVLFLTSDFLINFFYRRTIQQSQGKRKLALLSLIRFLNQNVARIVRKNEKHAGVLKRAIKNQPKSCRRLKHNQTWQLAMKS